MNKALLITVTAAFSMLTAYAVHNSGGIYEMVVFHLRTPEGLQIFADLLIAMSLLLVFMYRDAKATGRNFWFWAIFSITCGSFGPLLYFITAKKRV
jgi:hypothetical protein